jgi:hypothetical protein
MIECDPNSHPDQQIFHDLLQLIGTLTRYLQSPEHHVDEELLQQLVDSCDDAARYYRNEHCDYPPAWLMALRRLFDAFLVKARQHRIVSTGLH